MTIVTRVQRRACTVVGLEILGCQAPVTIETKSHPARVRRLGAYSHASYDSTTFGVLQDELAGNFESTFVSDLVVNPVLDGTSPTFAAQGYEIDAGLSSSHDGGCSWAFDDLPRVGSSTSAADAAAGASRLPITDLSVRVAAPGTAIALAWEPQPVTSSTPGYRSRFFATSDGGLSGAASSCTVAL